MPWTDMIRDPALLEIVETLERLSIVRAQRDRLLEDVRRIDIERALLADENRELKARIRAYERAANGQV